MDDQKVIILEGVDCTGKTQIVKALGEALSIETFRPEGQQIMREGTVEQVEKKILEGLDLVEELFSEKKSLIFDRYYPSEWVYSQVFDRVFQEDNLRLVDDGFLRLDTLIVICYKPFFVFYDDELIDKKYVDALQRKYLDFSDWTNCKVIFLDTTNENLESEVKRILQWVNPQ